jgi:large subunit ribosomal protein L36e
MTTKNRQVAREQKQANGIIAGINKGFQTTRRARAVQKNARLGVAHKRLRAVKAVVQELCGMTPLEKRCQELLRVGKDKRALKLCKKRLGTMTAAKKKRGKVEEMLRQAASKKK